MYRCLELARLAEGFTAPNPLVGAVLVYNGRIIGEGYHEQFGGPHAEVNCIQSVKAADRQFVAQSTLYVSLEPCAHFGKTPPCADLVIRHKIPKCVIGCRDPFPDVDGKGIEKLRTAGIETIVGVLEQQCKEVNRRFFTFHQKKRPYIILKWAQTANKKIAASSGERLLISNEYSNRLVHLWRSREAGILVGTNTALFDDPQLSNRHWPGPSPVRMVLDKHLRLPDNLRLLKDPDTIVFTEKRESRHYQLPDQGTIVQRMSDSMFQLKIISVLVEGGSQLLQSFIDEGLWDEARVITNTTLEIDEGLDAPVLKEEKPIKTELLMSDSITTYYHN